MRHPRASRGTRDERLRRELEFHFEEMVRAQMAGGVPENEARRLARLEFGGSIKSKRNAASSGAECG